MQTAEVIPFTPPPPPAPVDRICSFCKASEDHVPKMFSNGRDGTPQLKCICSNCVAKAEQRLRDTVAARANGVQS